MGPVLTEIAVTLLESPNSTHLKECSKVNQEQEARLQHIDAEIQLAERQLRFVQVKKQIAETELDIVGLQQTLQQQTAEGTPARSF